MKSISPNLAETLLRVVNDQLQLLDLFLVLLLWVLWAFIHLVLLTEHVQRPLLVVVEQIVDVNVVRTLPHLGEIQGEVGPRLRGETCCCLLALFGPSFGRGVGQLEDLAGLVQGQVKDRVLQLLQLEIEEI